MKGCDVLDCVSDVCVARASEGVIVGYMSVLEVDCEESPVSVIDVDGHEE